MATRTSVDDLGPFDAPPDDHTDEPRARLVFTWRTAVVPPRLVGVFAVAAGAVAWYGRSGYFVGVDADGEIAVFQGRPGGLLWFDPTLVESTGVDIDELTPVLRDTVEAQPEFASFDEARRYLANLAEQLSRISPPTTTTTTTGTTPHHTTTTSAASPQTPTVPRSGRRDRTALSAASGRARADRARLDHHRLGLRARRARHDRIAPR
jgi:PPM family protein phosphatase